MDWYLISCIFHYLSPRPAWWFNSGSIPAGILNSGISGIGKRIWFESQVGRIRFEAHSWRNMNSLDCVDRCYIYRILAEGLPLQIQWVSKVGHACLLPREGMRGVLVSNECWYLQLLGMLPIYYLLLHRHMINNKALVSPPPHFLQIWQKDNALASSNNVDSHVHFLPLSYHFSYHSPNTHTKGKVLSDLSLYNHRNAP